MNILERQVKIHHPFCKKNRCEVCLNDHFDLGEYLKLKCGNSNRIDWLGEYRTFMDKRVGYSTETEYGWGDPIIFEPEHINAFIATWHDDGM